MKSIANQTAEYLSQVPSSIDPLITDTVIQAINERKTRSTENPDNQELVEWVIRNLEHAVKTLAASGSKPPGLNNDESRAITGSIIRVIGDAEITERWRKHIYVEPISPYLHRLLTGYLTHLKSLDLERELYNNPELLSLMNRAAETLKGLSAESASKIMQSALNSVERIPNEGYLNREVTRAVLSSAPREPSLITSDAEKICADSLETLKAFVEEGNTDENLCTKHREVERRMDLDLAKAYTTSKEPISLKTSQIVRMFTGGIWDIIEFINQFIECEKGIAYLDRMENPLIPRGSSTDEIYRDLVLTRFPAVEPFEVDPEAYRAYFNGLLEMCELISLNYKEVWTRNFGLLIGAALDRSVEVMQHHQGYKPSKWWDSMELYMSILRIGSDDPRTLYDLSLGAGRLEGKQADTQYRWSEWVIAVTKIEMSLANTLSLSTSIDNGFYRSMFEIHARKLDFWRFQELITALGADALHPETHIEQVCSIVRSHIEKNRLWTNS